MSGWGLPSIPCRLQAVEISLPVAVPLCAELKQILPGKEPGIVAIVEDEAYCIVANRLDGRDLDIFLAGLQDFLAGTVALNLS